MVTQLQKETAQAIVNIFETGKPLGDYAQVTDVAGDDGQLSYGRSQASLTSGSLYTLVDAYCAAPGAQYASQLQSYLPELQAKSAACNADSTLKGLLQQAGGDPVMQQCQNNFFDQDYWNPAITYAGEMGFTLALSVAIIYDSQVQGYWGPLRNQVEQSFGQPSAANEQGWIAAYVQARRNWMATNSNHLLTETVYRMDTFQGLIQQNAWNLPLPVEVRGITLTEAVLAGQSAAPSAAPARVLKLTSPMMQGPDVLAVQQALAKAGFPCGGDGIFGQQSSAAVVQFQQAQGLGADGVVGPATLAKLGL